MRAAKCGLSASAICLLGVELDGLKRLEDFGVFRYISGPPRVFGRTNFLFAFSIDDGSQLR